MNHDQAAPSLPLPLGAGKTYFVSRHPGSLQWAEAQGIIIDAVVPHLDIEQIQPGDTVIGTLPVHLIAQVTARQAHYVHLRLDLPAFLRGRELSANDLEQYGAQLEVYTAYAVGCVNVDRK